jgi:hypothetical protein
MYTFDIDFDTQKGASQCKDYLSICVYVYIEKYIYKNNSR